MAESAMSSCSSNLGVNLFFNTITQYRLPSLHTQATTLPQLLLISQLDPEILLLAPCGCCRHIQEIVARPDTWNTLYNVQISTTLPSGSLTFKITFPRPAACRALPSPELSSLDCSGIEVPLILTLGPYSNGMLNRQSHTLIRVTFRRNCCFEGRTTPCLLSLLL